MLASHLGSQTILHATAENLGLSGQQAGRPGINRAAGSLKRLPTQIGCALLHLFEVGRVTTGGEHKGESANQNSSDHFSA